MATLPTPQNLAGAGELLQRLQELPWAIHGSLVVALVAGLILWAFGRKVVKPIFATLGGVTGGALGFFIAPTTGVHDVAGFPTPYIGLGLGALLGIAAGIALFRFAMAVSGGAVLAIAGIVGSVVYLHQAPVPPESGTSPATQPESTPPEEPAPEEPPAEAPAVPPSETPPEVEGNADAPPETAAQQAERIARTAAERTLAFLKELGNELSLRFQAYPTRARFIIVAAGLAGAAFGVLAGLIMPRRSAGAITALLGAAVWIPSLFWQLQKLEAPGHTFLASLGPASWAGVWLGASLLGIAIQWSGLGARKAKAESED